MITPQKTATAVPQLALGSDAYASTALHSTTYENVVMVGSL